MRYMLHIASRWARLLLPACILLAVGSERALSKATDGQAPWVGETFWSTQCTGRAQGFGPYDYTLRSQLPDKLSIVEVAHFTPGVEHLTAGSRSSNPLADLDYTLSAWPNHHRALNTAIRARLRNRDNYRSTGFTPAECYLQRAINFSPNDDVTRMLYGLLQHRMGRLQDALATYRTAEQLNPGNLQTQYNLGLLLTDLGKYDDAARYAQHVYARGFPLPGLRRRLQEKGYWPGAQ